MPSSTFNYCISIAVAIGLIVLLPIAVTHTTSTDPTEHPAGASARSAAQSFNEFTTQPPANGAALAEAPGLSEGPIAHSTNPLLYGVYAMTCLLLIVLLLHYAKGVRDALRQSRIYA